MPSIGETLSAERERQNRNLADAAAETRIRESYLRAIEENDFDALEYDVYTKGFIRQYAKYLDIDAEPLIEQFRRDHEKPEEIQPIPGDDYDEFNQAAMPEWTKYLTPPVLAAAGIVLVLAIGFMWLRAASRGADEDTAPGPEPAATTAAEDEPSAPPEPAENPVAETGTVVNPGGAAFTELDVVVTATGPVTLDVVQGQPPVRNAVLENGDSRSLTPSNGAVVFTVSDLSTVTVTVNGMALQPTGQMQPSAVRISCVIGENGCSADPL